MGIEFQRISWNLIEISVCSNAASAEWNTHKTFWHTDPLLPQVETTAVQSLQWSKNSLSTRFLMRNSAKRRWRLAQREIMIIYWRRMRSDLPLYDNDWNNKVFERWAVFQWPSCHSYFTYGNLPGALCSDRFERFLWALRLPITPSSGPRLADIELSESCVIHQIGLASRYGSESATFFHEAETET